VANSLAGTSKKKNKKDWKNGARKVGRKNIK